MSRSQAVDEITAIAAELVKKLASFTVTLTSARAPDEILSHCNTPWIAEAITAHDRILNAAIGSVRAAWDAAAIDFGEG